MHCGHEHSWLLLACIKTEYSMACKRLTCHKQCGTPLERQLDFANKAVTLLLHAGVWHRWHARVWHMQGCSEECGACRDVAVACKSVEARPWCVQSTAFVQEHGVIQEHGIVHEHGVIQEHGIVQEHGVIQEHGIVQEHSKFFPRAVPGKQGSATAGRDCLCHTGAIYLQCCKALTAKFFTRASASSPQTGLFWACLPARRPMLLCIIPTL